MTVRARPVPPSTSRRKSRRRGGVAALALGLCAAAADAEPLTPALPQTIQRGKPPGVAIARGGDWSRARRAELPAPAEAAVLWQRRIPGGLSGNVLVDDDGNVFVAGQGRVVQLSADGRSAFTRPAEFSSAAASALLSDGQRVVLGRDGRLAAWSARGRATFQLALPVPPGWTRGDLLPLPDGGVLVSAGAWLLQISSRGELTGYAQLAAPVAETLVDADHTWIISEAGDILSWDGHSPPVQRGSFAGQVSAAVLRAPGQVLALVNGGELAQWSLGTAQRSTLAKLDGLGNAAHASVPTNALVHVLGTSGNLLSLAIADAGGAESAPESRRVPPGAGELLSSPNTVAWFVANTPLTLRQPPAEQTLSEVVCAQPSSLAAAGAHRFVAACRSGQIWLIGPAASDAGESARQTEAGSAPVRVP
jgi:hypothetical protein